MMEDQRFDHSVRPPADRLYSGPGSGTSRASFTVAAMAFAVLLMVVLRVIALDSDPYPRLSWSTGLLTDEGFYIHNARNLALFGAARTDEFNNALIMPTLHLVQVAVFRQWGAGVVPARMISVVCGLLGVVAFFAGARRAFGPRVAMYGALFIGLDHVNLLYNRMALMDTPAEMLLIFAFCAWGRGTQAGDGSKTVGLWLSACGALLGIAFVTRGLAAFVLPAPFVAAWLVTRRTAEYRSAAAPSETPGPPMPGEANTGDAVQPALTGSAANGPAFGAAASPSLGALCLPVALGLGSVLTIYGLFWYLPHQAELAQVNRYYLWRQLLPNGGPRLALNFVNAWFGDDRGAAPFLMRHTPVMIFLALGWIVFLWSTRADLPARNRNGVDSARSCGPAAAFVTCWITLAGLFVSVANYSPSRYYLLFYPAIALAAAFGLANARAVIRAIVNSSPALILFGAYGTYHLALLGWHHGTAPAVALVGVFTLLGGAASLAAGVALRTSPGRESRLAGMAPAFLLIGWAGINGWYTVDWLTHLAYEQRNASRWLAANLPAGTVLIGDVAPGLCLYNTLPAIAVIPGLCNDRHPLEQFQGRPRAIVILDEPVKERWWTDHYPDLTGRDRRTALFPRIGRFPVGVYRVRDQR